MDSIKRDKGGCDCCRRTKGTLFEDRVVKRFPRASLLLLAARQRLDLHISRLQIRDPTRLFHAVILLHLDNEGTKQCLSDRARECTDLYVDRWQKLSRSLMQNVVLIDYSNLQSWFLLAYWMQSQFTVDSWDTKQLCRTNRYLSFSFWNKAKLFESKTRSFVCTDSGDGCQWKRSGDWSRTLRTMGGTLNKGGSLFKAVCSARTLFKQQHLMLHFFALLNCTHSLLSRTNPYRNSQRSTRSTLSTLNFQDAFSLLCPSYYYFCYWSLWRSSQQRKEPWCSFFIWLHHFSSTRRTSRQHGEKPRDPTKQWLRCRLSEWVPRSWRKTTLLLSIFLHRD